jgi:hypothetical protein
MMLISSIPVRIVITLSLSIAMSWNALYSCGPQTHSQSATGQTPNQCKCGCTDSLVGQSCRMACCQKQVPSRNENNLPRDNERNQTIIKYVSTLSIVNADTFDDSPLNNVFAELKSHLALPTLQSQHVCMQI